METNKVIVRADRAGVFFGEIISLTQNAYGGDIIQMLKPYYDQPLKK